MPADRRGSTAGGRRRQLRRPAAIAVLRIHADTPLLAVGTRHDRGGDVLRGDRSRPAIGCVQRGQARRRLAQPCARCGRCGRSGERSGGIAFYSSQGPTNDGRIKPDLSAPSCVGSTIYRPCFNGTSAASPAAAGMAALLLGQGLAGPGMPLAFSKSPAKGSRRSRPSRP